MANKARQILRDMNILVDGIGNIGVSKSVELPKVEFLTTERGGAMAVEEVVPLIKAMNAKISLNEYNTEAFSAANKVFGTGTTIFIKGSTVQGDVKTPILATLKGKVKLLENPLPEAGKEVEMNMEISVTAYSFEIDGKKKIDIDVENMICVIDGVDLYAELRAHIQ